MTSLSHRNVVNKYAQQKRDPSKKTPLIVVRLMIETRLVVLLLLLLLHHMTTTMQASHLTHPIRGAEPLMLTPSIRIIAIIHHVVGVLDRVTTIVVAVIIIIIIVVRQF